MRETLAEARYWVGVVSRDHVLKGVEGGFAQLCHGKAAPLRRMRAGDWLIYYSPRTAFRGGEPLHAFTAIGQVGEGEPYPFQMSDDFCPFRRAVAYLPCHEAPIRELLDALTFIPDKRHWGYAFRFGQLEIGRADFERIAAAMGVSLPLGGQAAGALPADRRAS